MAIDNTTPLASQSITTISISGVQVVHLDVTSADSVFGRAPIDNTAAIIFGPGVYTAGIMTGLSALTCVASVSRTAILKMTGATIGQVHFLIISGGLFKGFVVDTNSVANISAHYPNYFTTDDINSRAQGIEYRAMYIDSGAVVEDCHIIHWTAGVRYAYFESFAVLGYESTFRNCLIDSPIAIGPGCPYVTVVTGINLICDNVSVVFPDDWTPWVTWPGTPTGDNVGGGQFPITHAFTLYGGPTRDYSTYGSSLVTNCYSKNCTVFYYNDSFNVSRVSVTNNTADNAMEGAASLAQSVHNLLITGNTFNISPFTNGPASSIGWGGYGVWINLEDANYTSGHYADASDPGWTCDGLAIVNNTINFLNTGIQARPVHITDHYLHASIPEINHNRVIGAANRGSFFQGHEGIVITGTQANFLTSIGL